MTDTSAPESADAVGETFAALGNETRLQIIDTLWRAYDPLADEVALPFSALFDRVDYDTPSNFAYHLEKLVGTFVERSEGGYVLARPGRIVMEAVQRGLAVPDVVTEPAAALDCPTCGTAATLTYEDGAVRAWCQRCEAVHGSGKIMCLGISPAGLEDRSLEETFHAALALQAHHIAQQLDGVCGTCSGVVVPELAVCEDHDEAASVCAVCDRRAGVAMRSKCPRCRAHITMGVAWVADLHPAVTAFYHDHGIEHRIESWAAAERRQSYETGVVSRNPVRVRVVVPAGDEVLRLTIDGDLAVVESSRDRAVAADGGD